MLVGVWLVVCSAAAGLYIASGQKVPSYQNKDTPFLWRDASLSHKPVRWSRHLQVAFENEYHRVQFPDKCTSVNSFLLVEPVRGAKAGIFAAFHGFEVYALAGLVTNRLTAQVEVRREELESSTFGGCSTGTLHCFFQPLWKTECVKPAMIHNATRTRRMFHRDHREDEHLIVAMTYNAKIPNALMFKVLERLTAPQPLPELRKNEVLFVLTAMFAQMAQPREAILARAMRLQPPQPAPTILLQLRRTDKRREIKLATTEGLFMPFEVFKGCAYSLATVHNMSSYRIHVMSDDQSVYRAIPTLFPDHAAVDLVRPPQSALAARQLRKKHYVEPVAIHCGGGKPCISFPTPRAKGTVTYYSFVQHLLGEEVAASLRRGGHTKLSPGVKKEFHFGFLADLYSALLVAEPYFCATFSSNVGRYINEYIGGLHRIVQLDAIGFNGVSLDGHWKALH